MGLNICGAYLRTDSSDSELEFPVHIEDGENVGTPGFFL